MRLPTAASAALCSRGARAFSVDDEITEMVSCGIAVIDHPARQEAWRRTERFARQLVTAAEGLCRSGGHELALLADIVIAG